MLPKYALIRKIAGRWLVEVREAPAILISSQSGQTESKRLHWLSPGDQIRLIENGPAITFEPSNSDAAALTKSGSASRSIDDVINEVLLQREDDAPFTNASTKPRSDYAVRTVNSENPMTSNGVRPATIENATKPSDDEVATNVPVLPRVAWSEGDSMAGDEFSNDNKLTPEQAEIRWVLKVVMRCFRVGVIVLVVWLIVSALLKS